MMKAMILTEYNRPLQPVQMAIPEPGEDEVLVRVKACGLCQTDLKIIRGEIPAPIINLPHLSGHEVAGEVVAVGKRVSDVKVGDIGVVYIYVPCHRCEYCLTGRQNICANIRRIGFELPGGFAEYLLIPAASLCKFKKGFAFQQMAILSDAVATAYHAIMSLARVSAGQDVMIVGAGGLGLHGIQIAKLCGARVIAVDKEPAALDLAKEMGADVLLDHRLNIPQEVNRLTNGYGVDAVLEFVGRNESLSWSLPSLKRGGKLVLVGYAPQQRFPLDTMAMHYNEWHVIGSRYCHKHELIQTIRLVEEGKIKPCVSKTFPFDDINEALAVLQNGKALGRIVLTY